MGIELNTYIVIKANPLKNGDAKLKGLTINFDHASQLPIHKIHSKPIGNLDWFFILYMGVGFSRWSVLTRLYNWKKIFGKH